MTARLCSEPGCERAAVARGERGMQIETDTDWPMRHYINPQQELIP